MPAGTYVHSSFEEYGGGGGGGGGGLGTLPLFSVFMNGELLEDAYFLCSICFQWITYSEPSTYK